MPNATDLCQNLVSSISAPPEGNTALKILSSISLYVLSELKILFIESLWDASSAVSTASECFPILQLNAAHRGDILLVAQ